MLMVEVGDREPWTPTRGILGEEYAVPQWFILRTVSQREKAAGVKLEAFGVLETWYPAEEAWRIQRNAKRDRKEYEKLIAPGYLFALFGHEPLWHRLWDVTRGLVIGVVGIDDRPYAVPEEVLSRMRLMPKRIQLLREAETAKEKAERLARQPAAGQRARLTEGPLAGMIVDVGRIDRGIAAFLLDGIKGTARVEGMERVDPEPASGYVEPNSVGKPDGSRA